MQLRIAASVCALATLCPGAVQAQVAAGPLAVGTVAPDIELTGATRSGVLPDPVRLSDYRGKTVVLAFFYRARTPG